MSVQKKMKLEHDTELNEIEGGIVEASSIGLGTLDKVEQVESTDEVTCLISGSEDTGE